MTIPANSFECILNAFLVGRTQLHKDDKHFIIIIWQSRANQVAQISDIPKFFVNGPTRKQISNHAAGIFTTIVDPAEPNSRSNSGSWLLPKVIPIVAVHSGHFFTGLNSGILTPTRKPAVIRVLLKNGWGRGNFINDLRTRKSHGIEQVIDFGCASNAKGFSRKVKGMVLVHLMLKEIWRLANNNGKNRKVPICIHENNEK